MDSSAALTIFLIVAALGIIVGGIALVGVLRKIGRTMTELEQTIGMVRRDVLPRVEKLLESVEAELVEARATTQSVNRLTGNLDRITGTVADLTGQLRGALIPVIGTLTELTGVFRQGTAVLAGVKAGLGALRRPRFTVEEEETQSLFH